MGRNRVFFENNNRRVGWKPTPGLAAGQCHPLAPLELLEFFDAFDEMQSYFCVCHFTFVKVGGERDENEEEEG